MKEINQLCVHTYLQILRYPSICRLGGRIFYDSPVPGTHALVVHHSNNTFECGEHTGGVLDLAAWINGTTPSQVFNNQKFYKIDDLIFRCGSNTGPQWEPAYALRRGDIGSASKHSKI